MTVTRRVRPFVGREAELEALLDLMSATETRVACVHAIAGMGKSALLHTFLERAGDAGATVQTLDCRQVEPTERGFLSAVGGFPDVFSFAAHLITLPPPVVVVLDHVEAFGLLDSWLRQSLVPLLPDGITLVLAGRHRPVAGWFAHPGFQSVPLGPLDDADARSLLALCGARATDVSRLARIGRGHPLALILACAGVIEHPELELEDAALSRVIGELTRGYLQDVQNPAARRALEAASVIRRATGPVLAAMLGQADGDDALDHLLRLPFVESSRDGLVVHDAVREAVAEFMRGTNPIRYRAYRRAAWRELRSEAHDARADELWRFTADMLYLIDNPVVRDAFFPTGTQSLAVEPAPPDAARSIAAIAQRHEGPQAARLLQQWAVAAPDTFSVCLGRDGDIAGFMCLLPDRTLRAPLVGDDPVVRLWARHLREHPLPKDQVALGLRRWLDVDYGELPCPTQAACWLDTKRTYMALRPALRRMYVVVQRVATYWPVVERLGFRPLPDGTVVIDDAEYTSVSLDFGRKSVDGWLARLVAAELGISDEPQLDADSREIAVDGKRVTLTPLEFKVFSHLLALEGRTASRYDLLSNAWGTEFTGGSNVVDAVVLSLRRKLGSNARAVETIRGSGYRLRVDGQFN